MSNRSTLSLNSGDGSRPTTDGTVGNIGAAEKFSTRRNAVGEEVSEPANPQAMASKKQDAASAKHDDFGCIQPARELRSGAEHRSDEPESPRPLSRGPRLPGGRATRSVRDLRRQLARR